MGAGFELFSRSDEIAKHVLERDLQAAENQKKLSDIIGRLIDSGSLSERKLTGSEIQRVVKELLDTIHPPEGE